MSESEQTPQQAPEPEQLVIDDYELVNCIATGNVSQVWEVQQSGSPQNFAMKLLLDEVISDAEQRNTMKHEAKVGKALEHPSIIQTHNAKVTRKQAYIIMELFMASNLKQMIRGNLLNVHTRLPKLAESVTSAFVHMHEKGWIHKDIKPDNILINKVSDVRVIDFSLASKPGSTLGHMMSKKSSIAIQGTRTYIAPELIKREKLTPKADIYSWGITLYECLTGRPPFTGMNPNALLMAHIQDRPPAPSEFHRNISPQADALIAKMLSKKSADRHDSMQEVLSELRNMKFFKMDPLEFDKQERAAAAEEKETTIDQRLDSRSDHEYTQKHGHKPAAPKPPKPQLKPEPSEKKAPPQPAAQAHTQPPMHSQQPPGMPPQMPPGMMPPQPGMPYPQMPMQPGMMPPQPGMPYPQMPPGMPAHQPVPGQPMPPQGMPGVPQQPAPPGAPHPPPGQPPAQPAAGTPQPPPTVPAPPSPPPEKKESDAEPEVPEDIDWLNVM